MSMLGVYEILLRGLAEEVHPSTLHFLPRESAYQELKRRTGQDYGYDPEKWREYLRQHREELGVGNFEEI